MVKKEFQAESKRLLEMMIHSIYTHKEIFLRELISNASDAIDKLYFRSLTDENVGMSRGDFEIRVEIDKEARILKISDNGIGMTSDELEQNLGIIAKSGSLSFKKENSSDETAIIGQFGVGFYSAFMVADKVVVESRAYGADSKEAYHWESEGVDGYEITPCEKDTIGTVVTLYIKSSNEDENYDEFLESYRISALIKRYSDYIRFPIKMEMDKQRPKAKDENAVEDAQQEYESYVEDVTMNSMVPIWRKNKNELTEADYQEFYKDRFFDYSNPISYMHVKNEGEATYNALLYLPSKAPYDYYSKDFEKGLQLYSNGVLIMEKCSDLLPDHFSFVKGLVDSEDLSLNISREMLQHDRQLKLIAKSLERTIKNELERLLRSDRDKYEEFFNAFGLQLKYGVHDSFGANKDLLKDLLMFRSSAVDKYTTLKEYCERMKEDQKFIYYAAGDSLSMVEHLPQIEILKEKGLELLYFTDKVDEFAIQTMHSYDNKEFKNVSSENLDLDSEEERNLTQKLTEEHKDLLAVMKESLGDKVTDVAFSSRLKTHPVCLSSKGNLSMEMEKVLNGFPNEQKVKAEKVLEINASHPVFAKLDSLYKAGDNERVSLYASLLYMQSMLMGGYSLDNIAEFSEQISKIMVG